MHKGIFNNSTKFQEQRILGRVLKIEHYFHFQKIKKSNFLEGNLESHFRQLAYRFARKR